MVFHLLKPSLCFLLRLLFMMSIPIQSMRNASSQLGIGNSGLILIVVYTMRGDAVRLISARRATRQEAKAYEG
jgi:hypothetical protein